MNYYENICGQNSLRRQTVVAAYLKSKQLLLFAFELQDSLLPSSTGILTAVQRQTAVTAYLVSKQLLLFVFALHDSLLPSSTGIMTALRRDTAATAYWKSKPSHGKQYKELIYWTYRKKKNHDDHNECQGVVITADARGLSWPLTPGGCHDRWRQGVVMTADARGLSWPLTPGGCHDRWRDNIFSLKIEYFVFW